MTATTYTVPALAWVLPLTAVVCLTWAWVWRRWVVPRLNKVVARVLAELQGEPGSKTEDSRR